MYEVKRTFNAEHYNAYAAQLELINIAIPIKIRYP